MYEFKSFADSIIGVTYFDETAGEDFSDFDKAFVALSQVAAGNAWIKSLPSHGPDGSLNFGHVRIIVLW